MFHHRHSACPRRSSFPRPFSLIILLMREINRTSPLFCEKNEIMGGLKRQKGDGIGSPHSHVDEGGAPPPSPLSVKAMKKKTSKGGPLKKRKKETMPSSLLLSSLASLSQCPLFLAYLFDRCHLRAVPADRRCGHRAANHEASGGDGRCDDGSGELGSSDVTAAFRARRRRGCRCCPVGRCSVH